MAIETYAVYCHKCDRPLGRAEQELPLGHLSITCPTCTGCAPDDLIDKWVEIVVGPISASMRRTALWQLHEILILAQTTRGPIEERAAPGVQATLTVTVPEAASVKVLAHMRNLSFSCSSTRKRGN